MEIGSGSSSKVIPESVMEAVKRTCSNIDEVKANLDELLSYCDAETLSTMEPLERARVLLLIAKSTTTLFACMSVFFSVLFHVVCELHASIKRQTFFFFSNLCYLLEPIGL